MMSPVYLVDGVDSSLILRPCRDRNLTVPACVSSILFYWTKVMLQCGSELQSSNPIGWVRVKIWVLFGRWDLYLHIVVYIVHVY